MIISKQLTINCGQGIQHMAMKNVVSVIANPTGAVTSLNTVTAPIISSMNTVKPSCIIIYIMDNYTK